jgi:hypothetical protein
MCLYSYLILFLEVSIPPQLASLLRLYIPKHVWGGQV